MFILYHFDLFFSLHGFETFDRFDRFDDFDDLMIFMPLTYFMVLQIVYDCWLIA